MYFLLEAQSAYVLIKQIMIAASLGNAKVILYLILQTLRINEQMLGGAGTLTSNLCQHYVRDQEWKPGAQSSPTLHHLT